MSNNMVEKHFTTSKYFFCLLIPHTGTPQSKRTFSHVSRISFFKMFLVYSILWDFKSETVRYMLLIADMSLLLKFNDVLRVILSSNLSDSHIYSRKKKERLNTTTKVLMAASVSENVLFCNPKLC